MNTTIHDAEEFGIHVRQGGWRLGLLVARNVAELPRGRYASKVLTETLEKVDATRFAKLSGTSNDRVLRYLKAWNAAADQGIVPAPADLTPGEEIELDIENLPDWAVFYPPVNLSEGKVTPERKAAYEKAADEEGTTPANAVRIGNNPAGIAAAIKANPKAAAAASRALDDVDKLRSERLTEAAELEGLKHPRPVPNPEPTSSFQTWEALDHLVLADREMGEAVRASERRNSGALTEEARETVRGYLQSIRNSAEFLEEVLTGKDINEEWKQGQSK